MEVYKQRKNANRPQLLDKYEVLGFIAQGTYGKVYKAVAKQSTQNNLSQSTSRLPAISKIYAIKKFKPEEGGSGISQSACREINLCRELCHENIVRLKEIILSPLDKSICMVFEYAEYDLQAILQYHITHERRPLPDSLIKSVLWQTFQGLAYLHANWVLHRDLKPANILVTSEGVVKIADLGLARLYHRPLHPLYNGDKVIVTIWYRSPELLFGSRHYTKTIDTWAVGCIFAELMNLRPIFKGEEAKIIDKKKIPFQKDQVQKIIEVLGTPTKDRWPTLESMPDYHHLKDFRQYSNNLRSYFQACSVRSESAFLLLSGLLEYDPVNRLTAEDALNHAYFQEEPRPSVK
ncbi:kinase-like domain-containing protein [Paraphysoderma sedebokerense]|nr:kinase-like domain-containing protein [Paraphysoderma sedebokerense]